MDGPAPIESPASARAAAPYPARPQASPCHPATVAAHA